VWRHCWTVTKIQDGGRPPFWNKNENFHNSAAIWDVFTKFGTQVDMDRPQRAVTSVLAYNKIQHDSRSLQCWSIELTVTSVHFDPTEILTYTMLPYWIQFNAHNLVAIKHICRIFGTQREVPSYYSSNKSNISGLIYLFFWHSLPFKSYLTTVYSLTNPQIKNYL